MENFKSSGINYDSDISNMISPKSFASGIMDTQESEKEKCVFCPKLKSFIETYSMLNKALYLKYSSSQNYYYTKDINDIVENEKKHHVVQFKYLVNYENEEENLTRYYNSSEFGYKLNYLTEYYKYHKEVPRLFMLPISHTMNNFHDKKRRIEYFKIKKMLNQQNKGVITNNQQNERESTEERKTSVYSEDSERNSDMKMMNPRSKILDLLEISSKLDNREFQSRNKKNSKEMNSITLEEINYFLNKIPDLEDEAYMNNYEDNGNSKKRTFLDSSFQEYSEKEQNIFEKYQENTLEQKNKDNKRVPNPINVNLDPKDLLPSKNFAKNISNKNKDPSPNISPSVLQKKNNLPSEVKTEIIPKTLANALKKMDINKATQVGPNSTKNKLNHLITFRDLSKNIQIFNKLIETQKNHSNKEKVITLQKDTKSHRVFNSIDFNYNPNFKTSMKTTPKNINERMKTISLSNFQSFLNCNKEKLNEFMQNKLNFQNNKSITTLPSQNKLKNSSSNSIKKSNDIAKTNNHRRIMSSEIGKKFWGSAKQLNNEKNVAQNKIFPSTSISKKTQHEFDFFNEKNLNSPKPVLTTMTETSPSKHVKHFKPISPVVSIQGSVKQENTIKKPQPVGFRKLNLDEKIYMKKNRVKPKSFQLQLKTSENDSGIFKDFKIKDKASTSKNSSMNSKASGNLTAKSRNNSNFQKNSKRMAKGISSENLKNSQKGNESATQQMKINIISNFFNFNNGGGTQDTKGNNPIFLKLKNEFINTKNIPNYKFLDISMIFDY